MSTEDEWERIASNPDNLIVSDSLKGKIDLEWDEESTYQIPVFIKMADQVLSANLFSYESDGNEIEFGVLGNLTQLDDFLQIKYREKCDVTVSKFTFNGYIKTVKVENQLSEIKVTITLGQE